MVLLANRLNDWNTMPTSALRFASSLPSCGRGLPSMRMSPESMVSRRLMVRHIVDLPEPDGPTTTSTSPLVTVRLMSFRTCKAPKCFSTWVSSTSGRFGSSLPGTSGVNLALLGDVVLVARERTAVSLFVSDMSGRIAHRRFQRVHSMSTQLLSRCLISASDIVKAALGIGIHSR